MNDARGKPNRLINSATSLSYFVPAYLAWPYVPVWVSLSALAVGSAGYHWTRTDFWHYLDRAGMYMVAITLTVYATGADELVVFACMIAAFLFAGMQNTNTFMFVSGLVMASALTTRNAFEYAVLAGLVFGWAYFVWKRDNTDWWNHRETSARHGIWHVVTSIGFSILVEVIFSIMEAA